MYTHTYVCIYICTYIYHIHKYTYVIDVNIFHRSPISQAFLNSLNVLTHLILTTPHDIGTNSINIYTDKEAETKGV